MFPQAAIVLSLSLLSCVSAQAQLLLSEPVQTKAAGFNDEKTTFTFPYTNRSGKALEITGIEVGCGCLRPDVVKKTLAPGETGKLSFTFEHGSRYGFQEVKATVTTNDGKPAQELLAKLDIPTWVDISPRLLFWSDPQNPTTIVSEIKINTPEKRAIKEVKSATPGFKIEIEVVEEGRRYRLKATPEGKTPHLLSELTVTFDPALPASKHTKLFLRVM